MASNNVVRKTERLTKDATKAKIASGLQRAVAAHGKDKVAGEAGCDKRTIENALAHTCLIEAHTLLNILDLDETILDELLHSKGFRIIPHGIELSPDMRTVAQMSQAISAFIEALEDGTRNHQETLIIAKLLRPLLPRLSAIVHEADGLRSVA